MDNQGANLLRLLAGMMKSGGTGQTASQTGPSQGHSTLQNLSSLQQLMMLASSMGQGQSRQGQAAAGPGRPDRDAGRESGAAACREADGVEERDSVCGVTWAGQEYFAKDETGCRWRREERVELLATFCREGYAMAKRHGHFLVGLSEGGSYIAIPGRFLLEEQPAGGQTGFTLWQPIRGGETYFGSLEDMGEEAAAAVYGYWIARLDPDTLAISEA